MSSSSVLKTTSALLNGVEIINKIDKTKFTLIVNRVVKSLTTDSESFSEKEKEKLESSLELSSNEVHQLILTITHILNEVIYYIIKPPVLLRYLVENVKMESGRATAFVQLWSAEAESLVSRVKHKLVHSHQLSDVDWSLHIALRSDNAEQDIEPRAGVQLRIKDNESIFLDYDGKELSKFYILLENIQTQLDSLQ